MGYMAWLRIRVCRFICYLLGHSMVSVSAIWKMQRSFIDKRVEAVCVRCGYQNAFMADVVDNVFAESPVFKAIKKKGA